MRNAEFHTFLTHDDVALRYRYWPALASEPSLTGQDAEPPKAIVLFHRGHEHGGRSAHLVDELGLPDYAFFAWDARGHGLSPGERGASPSVGTSVRDIQTLMAHIQQQYAIEESDIAVIAQSVGAVLAATWVHDYAPNIRALVLASPAFKVKLYVPFARPLLKLAQALRGNFFGTRAGRDSLFVNSYVKANYLTHDPERIASFNHDPLIARAISVKVLLGLYDTSERIVADAQAIQVPVQLLVSGADFVVHRKPQLQFFERLSSPEKELHILPGFYHDTLGEQDRHLATARMRRFINQQFSQAPQPLLQLNADVSGWSRAEAEALAHPLPSGSLVARYWAATRAGLAYGAKYSEGLRLGAEVGFDSGSTLDYVYRNQPTGTNGVGRLMDKQYLAAIGWRGIRQRKVHIEELLQLAIARLQQAQTPVHIVDIAAGHGRYILEAISEQAEHIESVLLRDYSELNVAQGQALIEAKGLTDKARFMQGDAFDGADLAQLTPKPSLAVVSGLYELFADNDAVSQSLAGLASAMAIGNYLIYTNQPWHPQLAFIARALTSHRAGQAWVMRRRSQVEMDQLVARAGFKKLTQRVDEWGIFTVTLAQRVE